MLFTRTLLISFTVLSALDARYTPEPDLRTERMCAGRPGALLHQSGPYFHDSIPRFIHQVWFQPGRPSSAWQEHSQQFNYQYRLWTVQDDATLAEIMLPDNFTLMVHLRDTGNLEAAEQIVAYELLHTYGGLYVHATLNPPTADIATLVAMRGAVFATEREGASCGNAALFVTPDFMLSCPGHPLMHHLVQTIKLNYQSCKLHGIEAPGFLTGSYFLNRSLAGTFSVIPANYLAKFGTTISKQTSISGKADYDTRSSAMNGIPAEIPPQSDLERAYFNQPIPKNVFQIWFGGNAHLTKPGPRSWACYCESLGYTYRLWTEADDEVVCQFMRPHNYLLMLEMRNRHEYKAASDILRCELLREFGGVYADCDMGAPHQEGNWVDLERFLPMQGLVVTTEWNLRNINTSALFVLNGLMMSCPHHPLMEHYAASIQTNYESWIRRQKVWDMYITGPFLLNKVLAGSITIISPFDLGALGVWNP